MKTLDSLSPAARYWTTRSLEWASQFYDPAYDLLWLPPDVDAQTRRFDRAHLVRDSIWYALGLLMRQETGDIERAMRIIRAVLRYQFDEPGRVYHGTFRRAPEEPTPPPDHAVEWKDYDPNWREFICTVFLVMLDAYGPLLPEEMQQAMWEAIRKAAAGAFARRVPPHYTNISLMSALLMDHAGARFDVVEWRAQADLLARMIYALFEANSQTFWEYNSPTYYGVDLFALALWRQYGLNEAVFRGPGAAMEAALWRDIARFYHAGLRNLCGPFDRSYGMDMTHYVAVVGLWVALVVPPEQAPLPDTHQPFGHSADFYMMPPTAMIGAQVPEDALSHLTAFQGERLVERVVEPGRVATAWLNDTVMVGASTAHPIRSGDSQFHGATIHWQTPQQAVGWMRLRSAAPVDARAGAGTLTVTCPYSAPVRLEIVAPDLRPEMIGKEGWSLPGLNVTLQAEDAAPAVRMEGNVMEISLLVNGSLVLAVQGTV